MDCQLTKVLCWHWPSRLRLTCRILALLSVWPVEVQCPPHTLTVKWLSAECVCRDLPLIRRQTRCIRTDCRKLNCTNTLTSYGYHYQKLIMLCKVIVRMKTFTRIQSIINLHCSIAQNTPVFRPMVLLLELTVKQLAWAVHRTAKIRAFSALSTAASC